MPYWKRVNGVIDVAPFDIYSKNNDTTYQELIKYGKDIVSNPMFFSIGNNKRLKIIYAVPINNDGKIIGAAGIDLPLYEFFTPIIRQVRVLDVAHGFLIANNGVMTAHPMKWANVGKSMEFFAFEKDVIQAVKDGREASQGKISRTTGNKAYYQFVPIKFGHTDKPWSLAISLRLDLLNGRGPKVTW
jgi:methyl-accepting chemotaxis protein